MQTAAHTMPPPGRAQRRATGLFFAILLQVCLIYALVVGLHVKFVPPTTFGGPIVATIPKAVKPPLPQPVDPRLIEPKKIEATQPKITFDNGEDQPGRIHPEMGTTYRPGPADRGPLSIAGTHTTPPYPPILLRLGGEGTVTLRLTVSPQGLVTDAVVLRTSGYPGLDDAARAWVIAHWRYQPAIRGGAPVAAYANVAVRFNLKNPG